ncbi:hypothetical protein KP509_22G051200 [Ceratopteris richardii]|nr:hypothetical protein KP509_22G051200 [Ceratopteris richardii]
MGSVPAAEEDEALRGPPPPIHVFPSVPSSPSFSSLPQQQQQQFRSLPPLQHQQERRIPHSTVINGCTWYHQSPSPLLFSTDSYNPSAFPPSHLPLPMNPPYADGSTSVYAHDYAQGDGPCGCAPRISPGYSPYSSMHNMYRPLAGHAYDGHNQCMPMPYCPYDGRVRPCGPSEYVVGMPVSSPHSLSASQAIRCDFMMEHPITELPPRALRMPGRTSRQIVSWSGMTMPVVVTTQAAAVVEWIQRQSGDIFGFDLEWKPNRQKDENNSVALLQLCGPNECLIIQLLYTDMIPRILKEFLSNARKHLGGVGIRQDVKKLEEDHDLVCQGQVELGILASEKLQRVDLQWRSLKKLVDQVLGMTLVKVKKITMSNWAKEYLDERQIEYACIDAWAAYAVLQKLMTL